MEQLKARFIALLSSVEREGMDDLLAYLESSDFYEAPASTKYHGAYKGGLVEHCLNVHEALIFGLANLKESEFAIPPIKDDSVVIVALLHDLCKVNTYHEDFKNVKNANGVWEKVPTFRREPLLPMGHAGKSLFIIQKFIKLTVEEALAIYWHMGAYDTSTYNTWDELSQAYNSTLLAFLLQQADMMATYIMENDLYRSV